MTAIVSTRPDIAAPAAASLVASFLAGRSPQTLRAYRQDLQSFARWLRAADLDEAAQRLLGSGPGPANALALAYRATLIDQQLAAATVNRRLAALRSLVKLARTIGLVPWALEVPGLPAEPYRDTRGPGLAGVRRLLRERSVSHSPSPPRWPSAPGSRSGAIRPAPCFPTSIGRSGAAGSPARASTGWSGRWVPQWDSPFAPTVCVTRRSRQRST